MWVPTNFNVSSLSAKNVDQLNTTAGEIDFSIQKLLDSDESFARNGKKLAFITIASPEYDFGLKVLLSSIRRYSRVPIIVLASRRWGFETTLPGTYFLVVPGLFNERYRPSRKEIGNTLTKLWIFGIMCLDRIVFLDADCLVVKSIDDLFDESGLWCAADCVEECDNRRLNSGLIAFDPSPELRDLVFEKAYETDSYDNGDQGLLDNILRSRVKYLPSEYNLTRHYAFFHGPEASIETTRVIHYIVKKPWELRYRETTDVAVVELDDLWTKQLSHEELLQLVAFWRRRQFIAERPRLESLHQRGSRAFNALNSLFQSSRPFRYFLALAVLVSAVSLAIIAAVQIIWIIAEFRL
jgi:hypothetical protein